MLKRLLATLSFCALSSWAEPIASAHPAELPHWSAEMLHKLELDFGAKGAQRMRTLYRLVIENHDKPIELKLKSVNDALNHVPWISDAQKYHAEDYWATPLETVATFGGDCEDIAIAKYVVLRMMGVNERHLDLLYARLTKTGQAHMVLVYIAHPELPIEKQTLLVLGNIDHAIRPLRKRGDLLPIYLLNFNEEVELIDEHHHQLNVTAPWHHTRAIKLAKVKKAIQQENDRYRPYNNGHPIY